MFKRLVKTNIPEGTIYNYRGKEPLFVPAKVGLNETEAKELNSRLDNAAETVRLLREAVMILTPLHVHISRVQYEVNAMQEISLDPRVANILQALRDSGYISTTNDMGYLRTVLKAPTDVKSVLEEI
tara:strand:- start:41 stop:421 length:381 start_codon:yes stop_codon:yes gene_type:complete